MSVQPIRFETGAPNSQFPSLEETNGHGGIQDKRPTQPKI